MEEVGFEEESFLSLLNSGEEEESYIFSCAPTSVASPSSASCYSSSCTGAAQMLCFGGGGGGKVKVEQGIALHEVAVQNQKSCDSSLSSLSSSPPQPSTVIDTTIKGARNSRETKKKDGRSSTNSAAGATIKKARTQAPAGQGTVKVRREKLGERILTLQQLVSPFGKSDTASVLHEALGYIRFLHDQVQVLSSPYMQGLQTSGQLHVTKDGKGRGNSGLRSRGLCLVPIGCTEHIVSSNGADLWSPNMGSSNNCPSSKP